MDHRKVDFHMSLDQCTQDRQNFSRRIFLKGVGIVCLGSALSLQGCDNLNTSENMEATAKIGLIPKAMRPPTDLAVPAKTEMATFAMG